MLSVYKLQSGYGKKQIIHDVTLRLVPAKWCR